MGTGVPRLRLDRTDIAFKVGADDHRNFKNHPPGSLDSGNKR
jgi:hypothetical protein